MMPIIIMGLFTFVMVGSLIQLHNQMIDQQQGANQAFADMDVS